MDSLRKICFNRKGQALIEVAVFGAILLTVLSFLIRYGIIYNQRQSLDMRAFRKALSESVKTDRPDAEATVYLVEDKHIPDAGDIFGVGDIHTAEASASIVWGNTLENEYEDRSDLPRVKYIINEQETPRAAFSLDYKDGYTTAGYEGGRYTPVCMDRKGENFSEKGFIDDPAEEDKKPDIHFFVTVSGHDPIKVTMPELRSAQNGYDEDNPARVKVMVRVGDEKKDIITGIWNPVTKSTAQLLYAESAIDDAEHVGCIALLYPDKGDINLDYLALNSDVDNDGAEDVNAANMQGLLPSSRQVVTRNDSLILKDSNTGIESTTKNDTTIIVTHTVKGSTFEEDFGYYTYKDDEEDKSWTVQK